MKHLMWMIFLTCPFYSCVTEYSNPNNVLNERKDSLTLSFMREISLYPDEKTPSDWEKTLMVEKNDFCYILLYNAYNGDLNYYNSKTGELYETISTSLKGMDGISSCEDSILFVQDYKLCRFYQLNLFGGITDTLIMKNLSFTNGDFPPSYISAYNGVFPINKNVVFFTTFTAGENDKGNRCCGMIYDVKEQLHTSVVSYPSIYQEANWGGGMFRSGYTCYNPLEHVVLFSFPACHNLYAYNVLDKKIEKHYAGSRLIDEIQAFSDDINQSVPNNESLGHYLKTDNYGPIIYDKYRNLYYRIAEKAGYHIGDAYRYLKQLSIIIMDTQLNVIGEKTFEQPYGTTILVGSDGIYLPYLKNVGMDLPMHYHVFKICRNEYENN